MLGNIKKATELISSADVLLIGAGAGMGVDSGLPDFRGEEGFWRAYPKLADKKLHFEDLADGDLFLDNPRLAWWFYGGRYLQYKDLKPHQGFDILKEFCDQKKHSSFIFTSNVDGHFQKAGFSKEQIIECHGSLHFLQCANHCREGIWPLDPLNLIIDDENLTVIGELPKCPHCGSVARPNILMFDDDYWCKNRTFAQQKRYKSWLAGCYQKNLKIVVLEIGAGNSIATVRLNSDFINGTVIRINPVEYKIKGENIGIALGALDALRAIKNEIKQAG